MPADATAPPAAAAVRYHHGALREAMLAAAEAILERDGLPGLTLRAAAREAGVSHAAPKNHFGDLQGLLSELAAVGFARLADTMARAAGDAAGSDAERAALGRGYVAFARANPGLFRLMFRAERLDFGRPALAEAAARAFGLLSGAVITARGEPALETLTLPQAAEIMVAWALVHGLATLLVDGRFAALTARLPPGADEAAVLDEVIRRLGKR